MAKNILIDKFSEPINGAKTVKIEIHAGDGNLTIAQLTGDENLLASGTLQYLENQSQPTRTRALNDGQITFKLRGNAARQSWFRLPWAACNGATEWQVQLNPTVSADITAHSGGGNVKLNLDGMSVTSALADTGGGNVEMVLPDRAVNLRVTAKTGAGNVIISIPNGVAVRVHATTGLGKVIMDPCINQVDKTTYQSPDYEEAAKKVEITATSGAGNISISAQ